MVVKYVLNYYTWLYGSWKNGKNTQMEKRKVEHNASIFMRGYEAVSEWVIERVLCEDKTQSNALGPLL